MEKTTHLIALKINETLDEKGIGLSELAKIAGVSYMTAKAFREGNKEPQVTTLLRMSEAAGIPVSEWAKWLDENGTE